MTGLFVQIRLDSSRLPGKALLPLAGRTVTDHVFAALSGVPADVHALVTEPASAGALAPIADAWGFAMHVGPKEDVLARFAGAARIFGVSTIIRATGDNPLVSVELASMILRNHRELDADYSGFLEIPVGSGVEVLKTEALFTAEREASDPYEREHVSPFLYRNPERFHINRPLPEPQFRFPEARVTLDTQEDYTRILDIFGDLYRGGPIPIREVIGWFSKEGTRGGR